MLKLICLCCSQRVTRDCALPLQWLAGSLYLFSFCITAVLLTALLVGPLSAFQSGIVSIFELLSFALFWLALVTFGVRRCSVDSDFQRFVRFWADSVCAQSDGAVQARVGYSA